MGGTARPPSLLSPSPNIRCLYFCGKALSGRARKWCRDDRRKRSERIELILDSLDDPEETYAAIHTYCTAVLERKRSNVVWKLASVRAAFDRLVLPDLHLARIPTEPPSNTAVGRAFQERVGQILGRHFGEEFILEAELAIGTPPRRHRFDLVSRSGSVICECKAYTWTAGGKIPSAKITTLREAAGYLTQATVESTRVLAVARSVRPRQRETLGEYFVRPDAALLTDIVAVEIDESNNVRSLHGLL